MATKLDMGLDDIIKTNKKTNKKPARGGKGAPRGAARGGASSKGGRPQFKRLNSQSPLKSRSMNGGKWQHDKAAGAKPTPSGPTKLSVANLDFGVNDQDVNELFSRCGHIVKASVHYDANGRSQRTAEVVFRSYKEAAAAVSEYNGRLLDGRPMSVQIVGAPVVKPASLASRIGAATNRSGNRPRRGGRTGAASNGGTPARGNGGGRGGARGGRGGGRGGRGKPAGPPLTKDDLDKQMEEYRMQTDTA